MPAIKEGKSVVSETIKERLFESPEQRDKRLTEEAAIVAKWERCGYLRKVAKKDRLPIMLLLENQSNAMNEAKR